MRKPIRRAKGEHVLAPVRPSAAIDAEYRRRLVTKIEEMHKSIMYWITAAYRKTPPKIAQDELSAAALKNAIKKLTRRWLRQFDTLAGELADYFAKAVSERSDAALKSSLRKAGFTIDWTMTAAQQDILRATITEQVNLIKSIPRQYLTSVETHVMQSVQTGRDLGTLTRTLQTQFGATTRRAALISRDQNNKATAALNRSRQIELGITQAIWCHSAAGKVPRPAHVKAGADKVRYDVAKGWYDPHEKQFIWPGTLINCRCYCRPVIKGLQ